MTSRRAELVQVLRDCGVYGLDDQGIDLAFIRGECDVPLDGLEMDSLAAMEFCIALERSFELSISPRDLPSLVSLKQVADRIEQVSRTTSTD